MPSQRGRALAVLLAVAAGAAGQTPAVTQYQLTTGVNPSQAGTVSPPGGTFDAGTTVAVSAQAFNGYRFISWSGPVDSPFTSDARVVMSGPVTVVANFVQLLPPPELSP